METVTAPVDVFIYYKTLRYEGKWSYQVKMDFKFLRHEESITNFLLVENGVYVFDNENEAKIQAKRIGAEFKSYFVENLGTIITDVYNEDID